MNSHKWVFKMDFFPCALEGVCADTSTVASDSLKMEEIEDPHHNDVLCGRGVTINRWPGNESFRRLVSLNKEAYVSSTKRQKMSISRSIVEAVRALDPPGKFLEKDRGTGTWFEIGHRKAIEKTSQALRDGAASLRKQLSADFGDPNFLSDVFDERGEGHRLDGSKSERKNGDTENGGGQDASAKGEGSIPEETKSSKAQTTNIDHEKEESKSQRPEPRGETKSTPGKRLQTKVLPIKRGLRRSRSNPCLASSSSKPHRKSKQIIGVSSSQKGVLSPRSRYSASQPSSPVIRGAAHSPRHPYEHGDRVPPSHPQAYPYHHYPPDHASHETGYDHHGYDRRYYGRSYSYDHYADYDHGSYSSEVHPDFHHSQSWSHGPPPPYHPPASPVHSAPGAASYPWSYYARNHRMDAHIAARHPRPESPTPPSPATGGSMPPPGRHHFTPTITYRSDPIEHQYEEYQGTSPRYQYESRSPMHTERSPMWKSPHHGEHYHSPPPYGYATSFSESMDTSHSSGLSVPSLAGDSRHQGGGSSRPMLSPRSRASWGSKTPPRPPAAASSGDFAPPRSRSSRVRYIRRREKHSHPWEKIETYHSSKRSSTSPTGEEKKVEHDTTHEYPSLKRNSVTQPISQIQSNMGGRDLVKSDPVGGQKAMNIDAHSSAKEDECGKRAAPENLEKSEVHMDSGRSSPALSIRASPLLARVSVIANGDSSEHIEDIEMSPISQVDHEDPTTLMELPENLMALPISPCGPHDHDPSSQMQT